jgi:hypothetical protein
MDVAVMEWAKSLPIEQIPSLLVFLGGRLLTEGVHRSEVDGDDHHNCEDILLTAVDLARKLCLPESWIRSEARLGRLPSIRAGKYVRFKLNEVEKALAEKKLSNL